MGFSCSSLTQTIGTTILKDVTNQSTETTCENPVREGWGKSASKDTKPFSLPPTETKAGKGAGALGKGSGKQTKSRYSGETWTVCSWPPAPKWTPGRLLGKHQATQRSACPTQHGTCKWLPCPEIQEGRWTELLA